MLKIEDCKPGVEVIAIKNVTVNSIKPHLSIGMTYTIKDFGFTVKGAPSISLNEIDNSQARRTLGWGYYLWQLKLRDRNELIELFKLNDISDDLYRENYNQEELTDVKD